MELFLGIMEGTIGLVNIVYGIVSNVSTEFL